MKHRSVNLRRDTGKISVYVLTALICVYVMCVPALGLNPEREITQFYHTKWTVKDGAPGQVAALAQTSDGYLWLGTNVGLFRFDGVRFERYEAAAGDDFPSNNISALYASPTGGLWIGFQYGGASFVRDGRTVSYAEREGVPVTRITGFEKDGAGIVWAATDRGLLRFDGSKWETIGADWNFSGKAAHSVFIDRDRTLWVTTENSVVFLTSDAKKFQETGIRVGWIAKIAQSPDGTLWLADIFGTVQNYAISGNSLQRTNLEIPVKSAGLLFDHDGSFWVGSLGDGIRRVAFPKVPESAKTGNAAEIYTQKDGLSNDYVWLALEDREGNIWFGTSDGLDCFRYSHLVPSGFPAGTHDFALAADADGAIWSGSTNHPLMRLQDGITEFEQATQEITCAYRDQDGVIWFAGTSGVWQARDGKVVKVAPLPDETKVQVQMMTKDRDGALWLAAYGKPISILKDGKWTEFARQSELPEKTAPFMSLTDSAGSIWLAYRNNQIIVISGENLRTFSAESGLELGRITALARSSKNEKIIWAGGEHGLAFFDGSRFHSITAPNPESFAGISGIVETSGGDLWLQGIFGVFHIPAVEIQKALADADYRVSAESFDYLDGLSGNPTQLRPFPSVVETTDGRLWFATSSGVVWLDPRRLTRNLLPPPVSIESVVVDGQRAALSESLNLPAQTGRVEIDYAGLSLSIPERVRFKYKLEGADDDWQDAGARRQAFYNHLSPGKYSFHVRASNNDGVWNESGAVLEFTVAPAFYQTNWFMILCLSIVGCFVWLGYELRLRRLKSRLHRHFENRLTERTRIAQELHDSLLQGIVSASMQLSVAADQLPADAPSKPQFNRVIQLMTQVIGEGRNTLRGLRSPAAENVENIETSFAGLSKDFERLGRFSINVTVEGEPRPLRPAVRDEIFWIGREALLNSCRHSNADHIEIVIEYADKHLRVVVRDDGRGIGKEFLRSGRDGHFGLTGMRERANKIGARFNICERRGGGTEIEIIVTHRLAFADNRLLRLPELFFKWSPRRPKLLSKEHKQ